jgi:hypothetical protein
MIALSTNLEVECLSTWTLHVSVDDRKVQGFASLSLHAESAEAFLNKTNILLPDPESGEHSYLPAWINTMTSSHLTNETTVETIF